MLVPRRRVIRCDVMPLDEVQRARVEAGIDVDVVDLQPLVDRVARLSLMAVREEIVAGVCVDFRARAQSGDSADPGDETQRQAPLHCFLRV